MFEIVADGKIYRPTRIWTESLPRILAATDDEALKLKPILLLLATPQVMTCPPPICLNGQIGHFDQVPIQN